MAANTRFSTAVHLMASLAYHADETLCSDYLAGSVQTNPAVVRKLLAKLAAADLIESRKGKHGGVRLARDPATITLREIYQALDEGPIFAVHENPVKKDCPVSCGIKAAMQEFYDHLEDDLADRLEDRTLTQVLKKVLAKAPAGNS